MLAKPNLTDKFYGSSSEGWWRVLLVTDYLTPTPCRFLGSHNKQRLRYKSSHLQPQPGFTSPNCPLPSLEVNYKEILYPVQFSQMSNISLENQLAINHATCINYELYKSLLKINLFSYSNNVETYYRLNIVNAIKKCVLLFCSVWFVSNCISCGGDLRKQEMVTQQKQTIRLYCF